MSNASHNVPRSPIPVNRALALPEIAQAFALHAPVLQERLNRSLPIRPTITRTWRNGPAGRAVVDITIHTDPQADQYFHDQRRVFLIAREMLIQMGFVALPVGPTSFRLMSYHGSRVAPSQEQAA